MTIFDKEQVLIPVFRTQFGVNLLTARKSAGLTQKQVAEKMDSSSHHTRISNWEKGISTPTIENLVFLCHLYGVTPNDLLGF